MKYIKKYFLDIIIVLVFFCAFFIFNFYLYSQSPTVPEGDLASHLLRSLKVREVLVDRGKAWEALFSSSEYPPLPFIVATGAYQVFGVSQETASLSLVVFSLLTIFAMYFLGLTLGGRILAFIVTLLTITSPVFVDTSHSFVPDAPLVGMVALALLGLLWSDDFRNYKGSLFFGIAFALGMLTKFTFLHFILGIILFYIVWITWTGMSKMWKRGLVFAVIILLFTATLLIFGQKIISDYLRYNFLPFLLTHILLLLWIWKIVSLYQASLEKKGKLTEGGRRFFNLVYAAIIFILIAGPWYLASISEMLAKTRLQYSEYYKHYFSMPFMLLENIAALSHTFVGALPAMIAGVLSLYFKKRKVFKVVLIIGLVSSFFLISYTEIWPARRYLLPILPYVVLLGTIWLADLKKVWRYAAAPVVLLICFSQVWTWFLFTDGNLPLTFMGLKKSYSPPEFRLYSPAFKDVSRQVIDDLREMEKESSVTEVPVMILNFTNDSRFDLHALEYYSFMDYGFPVHVMNDRKPDPKRIQESKYLLVSYGGIKVEDREKNPPAAQGEEWGPIPMEREKPRKLIDMEQSLKKDHNIELIYLKSYGSMRDWEQFKTILYKIKCLAES
ncbi:MAG: glycosyltransferase family 39 protein [Chloroflexi bacterium]|nr:glycosyltransferase family 39 protein [Chloroflexota bacterium]